MRHNEVRNYNLFIKNVFAHPSHAILLFVGLTGITSVISNAQDQCNKTVEIYEEVQSPQVTPENHGKTLLCHYRFRPFRTNLRGYVLRIRFIKFKVGRLVNDSYCENGYVQVINRVEVYKIKLKNS